MVGHSLGKSQWGQAKIFRMPNFQPWNKAEINEEPQDAKMRKFTPAVLSLVSPPRKMITMAIFCFTQSPHDAGNPLEYFLWSLVKRKSVFLDDSGMIQKSGKWAPTEADTRFKRFRHGVSKVSVGATARSLHRSTYWMHSSWSHLTKSWTNQQG